MACFFNVACVFCVLCALIGLTSLVQFCLGIYLSFIDIDIIRINHLIRIDKFDLHLAHIIYLFMDLGLISLLLTFFSVYGTAKRNRPLSTFATILWVFVVAIHLGILTILCLYYYLIFPKASPEIASNLLDVLQIQRACCGINNKNDFKNNSFDMYPSSCCQAFNCSQDADMNIDGSNSTISIMHHNGCYTMINEYVTIELWAMSGITAASALLPSLIIAFISILNKRYQKLDDKQNFVISHLGSGISFNESASNSSHHILGSSKTIEETVETTQI